MDAELRTPFFDALLARHPNWGHIPLLSAQTEPRSGVALIVPDPPSSDLFSSLLIEDDEGEITIGFDHSHIHLDWPPHPQDTHDPIWHDPLALVDAVLAEKVVASSGWINGQLRAGSLHSVLVVPKLYVCNLEHIRVRSWLGTHDQDGLPLDESAAERQ